MSKQTDWVVRTNADNKGYIFYNRDKGTFTQLKPDSISSGVSQTPKDSVTKAPLKVYFDMTYRCNLECRHCITQSSPFVDITPELPTTRILGIVEELADLGVLEIAIGGGEPMVHPDWAFIFKHITDLNINLIVTTNGLLLNERNLQILHAVKPLETRVSFDGGKAFHNSIRGRDTYTKALRGLYNLHQKGLNATARFTYCNGADTELESLFADISKTGVSTIKIAVLKKAGRAIFEKDLIPQMPDADTAMWFQCLGKKYKLQVQLSSDDFPINYLETHDPKLRDISRSNCGAGFETCYISPYGQVLSCVTMPHLSFGALHKESFISVWQSKKAEEYRTKANACGVCRICDGLNK
jgi:MoaA/NifB/PqqE/SkfB family radical SAM enzyme